MVEKIQSDHQMEFTLFNTSCKLVMCIVLMVSNKQIILVMTAAWLSSSGAWHLNTTQQYRRFWHMGQFTYFIPWFD